jgi:hypothetical protein
MSLYEDAQANWPEDEAVLTAEYALDLFKIEGRDEYHNWLVKECSCVVNNLFNDDEDLIERYKKKFNALTAHITNFYM